MYIFLQKNVITSNGLYLYLLTVSQAIFIIYHIKINNMTKQALSFSRKDPAKFFKTLNKRVNDYFKENNLKRTGNWKLYTKAIVMFSLLIVPVVLILTVDLPTWAQILGM